MLRRSYSEKSLNSLNKLQKYEDTLIKIERSIIHIENIINLDNYVELINQLAQLNGNIDKIQYEGIDSIITAELITGKVKIKRIRKFLNLKCEIIRQKILDINIFLNQVRE